jgi:Cu(I)/Ag(I) efflux system membrane fusion protein
MRVQRPANGVSIQQCGALLSLVVAAACQPAQAQNPAHGGHASMVMPAEGESPGPTVPVMPPAGHAHVPWTPDVRARLNLRSVAVTTRKLTRSLHVVGLVVPDETLTSHVHAKVRGWIESIAVNVTGQAVAKGEVLCTLYSPEVYAAQLELVSLLGNRSLVDDAGEYADSERQVRATTIAAARRRLQLLDMPREDIQRIVRTRKAERTFTLRASRAGTIVAHQALAGTYVDAATELYTVVDLSRLWIQLDVPATDARLVRTGQHVQITVQGRAEPLHAVLAFLAPSVDAATRTVQARVELDDPGHTLRPGEFATATIEVDLGEGLTVPDDAVLWTGPRSLVFVVHPDYVEPREVTVTATAGGWARVAGLQNGEIVAAGSQFLIDAESRIRATSDTGMPGMPGM